MSGESRDPELILTLLQTLPPSKELLDFYKGKLSRSRERERKFLEKWKESGFYYGAFRNMESRLEAEKQQNTEGHTALVDLKNALDEERKLTRKLYAQNHGYAARELENRRKIQALLKMSGKTDSEVAKIVDSDELHLNLQIPDKLLEYISDKSTPPPRVPTKESLTLELAVASRQLVDQEKCHLEQISRLGNEIRNLKRKNESLIVHYESRMKEISLNLLALEKTQKDLAKDFANEKERFQRGEESWEKEKEKLLRKTQFLEHYGGDIPGIDVEGGGLHTSRRNADRRIAEKSKTIQNLNSELAGLKSSSNINRSKLLTLEAEVDHLREQNDAFREEKKEIMSKMKVKIDTYKHRFDDLEQRRKLEMEGYQSDIKLLTEKLRTVQRKLLSATVGKSKEHNYLQTIRSQDDEIERLSNLLKKNPEWR